jgi:outer membrane protein OmpA-like peptidoglycan-associated protein
MAALKPTRYQIPIKKKELPLPEPQIPSARTLILKIVDADNQSPLSANIKYNDQTGKVVSLSQVSEKSIPITSNPNFSVDISEEGYISTTETISDTAKTVVKTILLHRLNVGKAIVMKNVLFQRGTTILLESSKPDLLNVINLLKENPKVELEIAGHTDNVGDADMNLELSEKRAATIKKYLVDNGIASKRVTSKGYGKTKPIADNSKEETRKLNRRVEYIITKI